MSSPEQDGPGSVPSPLVDVLEEPSQGQHRLPYLLSLIDEDDVAIRLRASCALCLVVEEFPGMLEYVVRRLIDRLDDDSPTEVVHTLDYLAAEYPHEVDEVLVELKEEAEVEARTKMYRTGGGYARSDYLQRTEPGSGVERTRADLPGGSESTSPRQAYSEANDDADSGGSGGTSQERATDADETETRPPTEEDITEGTLTRGRISVLSDRLSAVIDNSQFDSLDILAARRQRRYADVYRTLGTVAGEEQAIGLMVFHQPSSDGEAFVERFRERFQKWTAIHDHDNVHTVYDWGWRPRPWAAVEYTGTRLVDRGELDFQTALDSGRQLAEAMAYAHQRGIVHGGIDPKNVAYVGNAMDEEGVQPPLLTNVGLLGVYRWFSDPVSFLDPRYAAPEYFDERFGTVDHLTDIYQLGMVLYRLFAGRPPYAGQFETIREQAVKQNPTPPSRVNGDLPPAVDQVVAKATAKQKMARYESITHLQQELCSLTSGSNLDG